MWRDAFVGVANWRPEYDNQYMDRLMAAVRAAGVTASPIRLAPLAVAFAYARGIRVVHVHWPEYLVAPRTHSSLQSMLNVLRLLRVVAGMAVCRLLRVKVVWTVHNLGPHETTSSWGAFRAYDLVSRHAHVFVVHSHAAAARAEARFPRARGRVAVAPHGHYLGVHPPARTDRAEVRANHGIPPDAFLLLAFGQIRPYKRLAELSRALVSSKVDEVHLLITGVPLNDAIAEELFDIAKGSKRLHVEPRHVPDEQVSDLYQASDAAVMNYGELFSSGSLLLALSQGVPVVSAQSDAVDEVASFPAISTYQDLAGLAESVHRLREVDCETRRSAALAAAEAATWERAAAILQKVYLGDSLDLRPRAATSA